MRIYEADQTTVLLKNRYNMPIVTTNNRKRTNASDIVKTMSFELRYKVIHDEVIFD